MAGAEIKIDARSFERKLQRAIRRITNSREIFTRINRVIMDAVARNFAEEGRPKWKRRKDSKSHKILDKSGKLKASIKPLANSRGGTVGTSIIYGPTHQFGRGPIPARPFLTITDQDEDEIVRVVEDYITGAFR